MYRIKEHQSKNERDGQINVTYYVQELKQGWFKNKWTNVQVTRYGYFGDYRETVKYPTLEAAQEYITKMLIPLKPDIYHYPPFDHICTPKTSKEKAPKKK